ncbi:MAG: hypothetical protein NTX79_06585 [Candidatus Micrarchaeota archaeon]|nr:hypothetical protein [Candidatus Micrarchaeota archaeon]
MMNSQTAINMQNGAGHGGMKKAVKTAKQAIAKLYPNALMISHGKKKAKIAIAVNNCEVPHYIGFKEGETLKLCNEVKSALGGWQGIEVKIPCFCPGNLKPEYGSDFAFFTVATLKLHPHNHSLDVI